MPGRRSKSAASSSQLTLNLDFAGQRTDYSNHAIHAYSAKFPPQLPAWAIQQYTREGETILDPMLGSGTTLVEARRLGRNAVGTDIDPLARLISGAKSNPPAPFQLEAASRRLLNEVEADFKELSRNPDGFNCEVPEFPNRDFWFFPETVLQLSLLKRRILQFTDPAVRNTLLVAFSSLIITKGKRSVANVADLAHSRPHHVEPDSPPDVLALLKTRLKRLLAATERFWTECETDTYATVVGADAKNINLPDDSVDLVFTSPPYVNAIDYPRAHKFSLFWIGDVLGVSPDEYVELGKHYIGTDRVPLGECRSRVMESLGVASADEVISQLSSMGDKRAGVTHRYFAEMEQVLGECARVVRRGRRVIVVVCPSVIAGIDVPTHEILADIGNRLDRTGGNRLAWEETYERTLDDSKRQMPVMRGCNGVGMRTEYVVVMRKE